MKITKFGHACLLIEEENARILIDPGAYSKGFEALKGINAVLITHQHADHVTFDNLAMIRENNSNVKVFADEGTVKVLGEKGDTAITAVHAGEEFEVEGVKVGIFGSNHAVIHPAIPGIENVGYFIAERFFYPGDNFTDPGVPVEILGLPIGAPWLKISEVIDYVVQISPKTAIPVHDATLAMLDMYAGIVSRFVQNQSIDIQIIENGKTAEY